LSWISNVPFAAGSRPLNLFTPLAST
jgi:hypothetical protein